MATDGLSDYDFDATAPVTHAPPPRSTSSGGGRLEGTIASSLSNGHAATASARHTPPLYSTCLDVGAWPGVTSANARPPCSARSDASARSGDTDSGLPGIGHTARQAPPPYSVRSDVDARSGFMNVSAPSPYTARSGVGARYGAPDASGPPNVGPVVHHTPPPYSTCLEAGARLGVSGASGCREFSSELSLALAGQLGSAYTADPPDPFADLPLAPS